MVLRDRVGWVKQGEQVIEICCLSLPHQSLTLRFHLTSHSRLVYVLHVQINEIQAIEDFLAFRITILIVAALLIKGFHTWVNKWTLLLSMLLVPLSLCVIKYQSTQTTSLASRQSVKSGRIDSQNVGVYYCLLLKSSCGEGLERAQCPLRTTLYFSTWCHCPHFHFLVAF